MDGVQQDLHCGAGKAEGDAGHTVPPVAMARSRVPAPHPAPCAPSPAQGRGDPGRDLCSGKRQYQEPSRGMAGGSPALLPPQCDP